MTIKCGPGYRGVFVAQRKVAGGISRGDVEEIEMLSHGAFNGGEKGTREEALFVRSLDASGFLDFLEEAGRNCIARAFPKPREWMRCNKRIHAVAY
jgi:hypothetical protein